MTTPDALAVALGATLLFQLVHLGLLVLVARRLPPTDYGEIVRALDDIVDRLKRAPAAVAVAAPKEHACRFRFDPSRGFGSEERTNKLIRQIAVCESRPLGCRNVDIRDEPEPGP